MAELVIHTPDGKTQTVQLNRDRFTLGRSTASELCFSDDAGLSRQHLAIERDGSGWKVSDLGSKNGTLVNGMRITAPHPVTPSDRIMAGHLMIEFADGMPPQSNDKTVVFIEQPEEKPSSSTVMTSLKGLLSRQRELSNAPQVEALVRAGRELAGHRPLGELFDLIMQLSIDAVGAARGVLMTLEGDNLVVRAARGEGFRISTGVRDRVLNEKCSLLVRDARLDEALAGRLSIVEQQIRSILAVPLQTDTRVIGLIYLDSPHFVHEFNKDDMNLLTVMANVAAIRIEHARLNEVEQTERVLAKELEQAAEIQQRLLPTVAPNVPGVQLAGHNAPCRTVGGDYYDFIPYPDGRVAMVVGDVAGKGMPASLLMSSLQARVQVLFEEPDNLGKLVARLNRVISSNCPKNRFITFFACILDPNKGELAYCNAGHNPPLLVRADGTVEELKGTGIILGIMAQAVYEEQRCKMNRGDVLALFSDGVTEACQPQQDEEFGEDRLAKILVEVRTQSAREILDSVNKVIAEWMCGGPPADDVTLVIAKRPA